MNTEQKAKAYDEALEKAREWHNDSHITIGLKGNLEDIFPELKENEDERIRKEIIETFKILGDGKIPVDINYADIFTWLEKQGKQKSIDDLTQQEVMDIAVAKCFEQSGQKPVDKVEPKFHEGEWIVDNQGLTHQIERVVENVTTHTFGYDIVGGGYFNDNTEGVRLWTIQDAKDGDVLASDNSIFIFQEEYIAEKPIAYCGLMNGCFIVDGEDACWTNERYYPATKEQRDTLFKAMADTGWEFDFEKKELKKIEQEIVENSAKVSESSSEEKDMCEYKKGFECGKQRVLKYPEDFDLCKKSVWSEEDEEHTHSLLDRLEGMCKKGSTFITTRFAVSQDIDWLKSLEERYTWKPSEEQIVVLELASKYERVFTPEQIDILIDLKEQLKKLKVE